MPQALNLSFGHRASARWIIRAYALVVILASTAWPLLAQDSSEKVELQKPEEATDLPWEKGGLKFGGFLSTIKSELTFGIEGAHNGSINAEDLLGLDTTLTVFRLDAFYRPGKSRRNQIDFTYAAYDRDGSATLSRDLNINGQVLPVGAQLHTILNFDLFRGAYSYAFVQNDRVRLGAGLGVYGIPLHYSVSAETQRGRSAIEGADTWFPLPALVFRSELRIIDSLFLEASADGMYVQVSSFKGSFVEANIDLEYRFLKHFGVGIGYSFMDVNVEGEGNSDYPGVNFIGSVGMRFSGLLFYGKASF